MKVAVVGPGAMGCLFAARMAAADGISTTLVDHKPDRAKRLAKNGIQVETQEGQLTAKPGVTTEVPEGQDLVVVLIKAYSTAQLQIPENQHVLTLQNGLGNAETLCSIVGSANVLAGITYEASTLIEEGHVRHVASGKTTLGSWTTCSTAPAMDALSSAGFEVEATDVPGQLIWEKVAINAGINPLTALLNVPNGHLVERRETRQLLRDLVVEASKVASTEGYRFLYSLVERAEDVCRQTHDNISSMLQDVRAGKKTEIDAISGEVLARAQTVSLPTPRTRVIYQLIKGLERH